MRAGISVRAVMAMKLLKQQQERVVSRSTIFDRFFSMASNEISYPKICDLCSIFSSAVLPWLPSLILGIAKSQMSQNENSRSVCYDNVPFISLVLA